MKYIKITNEGLIEKGAFALMGASTKREDDKKIAYLIPFYDQRYIN